MVLRFLLLLILVPGEACTVPEVFCPLARPSLPPSLFTWSVRGDMATLPINYPFERTVSETMLPGPSGTAGGSDPPGSFTAGPPSAQPLTPLSLQPCFHYANN